MVCVKMFIISLIFHYRYKYDTDVYKEEEEKVEEVLKEDDQ